MRVLNILKPKSWTSFDVVRFVKRRFNEKKVGHLGTLDPMATGVLPIFLGKATRLIPLFDETDKTYLAGCKLGERTNTFDAEGEILETRDTAGLEPEQVIDSCRSFMGTQEQLAPIFSALKIKGVPSYKLARKGEEPERKKRTVTVHELEVESIDLPFVKMRIRCSKGTYIRTIADDLGQKLGTGAHLVSLERTACGNWFHTKNAISIEELKEIEDDQIPWISAVDLLSHLDTVTATPEMALLLQNGQRVRLGDRENGMHEDEGKVTSFSGTGLERERVKVLDNDHNLIAIGNYLWENGERYFKPDRVFVKENQK